MLEFTILFFLFLSICCWIEELLSIPSPGERGRVRVQQKQERRNYASNKRYTAHKNVDVVMSHAYTMLKRKQTGLSIPQDEFKYFEQAKIYALDLNRRGLLGEMYERIMKGLI